MTPETTARYAAMAMAHSDSSEATLRFVAERFVASHTASPGLPSLEIGTRCGGSAWLCARLLQELYQPADIPLLVTVDPYGQKPPAHAGGGLYDATIYLDAKRLLASFPFHVHFYLRSVDFLGLVATQYAPYWAHGAPKTFAGPYAFAYLDGDHDTDTIVREVTALYDRHLIAPLGLVVIDNAREQQHTVPWLESRFRLEWCAEGSRSGTACIVGPRGAA